MPEFGGFAQYGVAGLALLALILGIKLVTMMLAERNGSSRVSLKSAVFDMARQVFDLHAWHAPDSEGRMSWKGAETASEVRALHKTTREVAALLREIKGALERRPAE